MKKNYNYAYDNLLRSWTDNIQALKSNNLTELAQILGDFEFTRSCLERLKGVINQLEELSEESLNLPLHDSQPSSLNKRSPLMLEDTDEKVMSSSEMQRKMACYSLERTRQDFEFMYKDIKSELAKICQQNDTIKFKELLLVSPWMVGALVEIGKELSIQALTQSNFEMFDLIVLSDSNFSQYKLEVLKTVLFQKNLDVIKFLLAGKYSPGEVSGLLGSKEYYASSREIVEEITKFLSESPAKLSAKNYNAMFLYSNHLYKESIDLFEEVIIEGIGRQKQLAQFYKGLCLQYSGDIVNATVVFKSIVEGDIDEYYDKASSIKHHAQQHLDSLDNILGKQTRIIILEKEWKEDNNPYLEKHKEPLGILLHQIYEHMNSPSDLTVDVKKVISSLSKIKFISIKQDAPKEIVSAQEFLDLPDLYSHMISNLDGAELDRYCKAVQQIEHTIEVIGEITVGLIVSEVL